MCSDLIIRTDASTEIGTGHLMRCLAVAQGWKSRGGQAKFITACKSDSLCRRIREEGFSITPISRVHPDPGDWEVTSQVLEAHPDSWVVLDGYHFDPDYQRQIKEVGNRLLLIDDMSHLGHYYADVLLNQNIHAEDLIYPCAPETVLLMGPKYLLLRREFLEWGGWKREIRELAHRVLVSLGGSDPNNVTLKVINALKKVGISDLDVKIVVGPSNPNTQVLQNALLFAPFSMRLLHNVTNMPELMAWADIAVTAGGSTCWEIAFMGLPNCIIVLADNQQLVAEHLQDHGVSVNMGWFSSIDETRMAEFLGDLIQDKHHRRQMSRRGRSILPGQGTQHVNSAMLDYT